MLPDWRALPTQSSRAPPPASSSPSGPGVAPQPLDLKGLLEAFVADDKVSTAAAASASGAAARASNRDFLVSLDHQLRRGCGQSLAAFRPHYRLRRLQQDEVRYLAKVRDEASGDILRRSCVHNPKTGERHFECPIRLVNGVRDYKVWRMTLDMGSIGWPAVQWLVYEYGIRSAVHWDRHHRLQNDWKEGYTGAGLAMSRLQFGVVMNMVQGPFKGSATWRLVQSAMTELFEQSDHKNPVFACLYDRIAFDLGESLSPSFGTDSHMETVWRTLKENFMSQSRGEVMKLSRWFAWEHRGRSILRNSVHGLFLALIYIGWCRGWWRGISDSPLVGWQHMRDEPPAPPQNAGEETPTAPRVMAATPMPPRAPTKANAMRREATGP